MTKLTNTKKRMIHFKACDILREDAFGHEYEAGKPKGVQIYDADWFRNKFSLTKEDALSLLKRLIKDEKLEEVEEGKYKAICKCSICGKIMPSDICEVGECHHIENYYGYLSRYDNFRLDMDLCVNCYDDLTDYLLSKARNKHLYDYSYDMVIPPDSDEENPHDYSTKKQLKKWFTDEEIDDVIPF